MNSDQLQRETRMRLRMVPVAVLAGLLPVAAAVTSLAGAHASVDEETLALITVHRRFPLDLIGAVIALLFLRELAPSLRDQLMVSARDQALVEARARGLTDHD